jgi:hypothetical protein
MQCDNLLGEHRSGLIKLIPSAVYETSRYQLYPRATGTRSRRSTEETPTAPLTLAVAEHECFRVRHVVPIRSLW